MFHTRMVGCLHILLLNSPNFSGGFLGAWVGQWLPMEESRSACEIFGMVSLFASWRCSWLMLTPVRNVFQWEKPGEPVEMAIPEKWSSPEIGSMVEMILSFGIGTWSRFGMFWSSKDGWRNMKALTPLAPQTLTWKQRYHCSITDFGNWTSSSVVDLPYLHDWVAIRLVSICFSSPKWRKRKPSWNLYSRSVLFPINFK